MGETIALQAYATPCQMITSFVVIFQPFLKIVVYDDRLEIFFNYTKENNPDDTSRQDYLLPKCSICKVLYFEPNSRFFLKIVKGSDVLPLKKHRCFITKTDINNKCLYCLFMPVHNTVCFRAALKCNCKFLQQLFSCPSTNR